MRICVFTEKKLTSIHILKALLARFFGIISKVNTFLSQCLKAFSILFKWNPLKLKVVKLVKAFSRRNITPSGHKWLWWYSSNGNLKAENICYISLIFIFQYWMIYNQTLKLGTSMLKQSVTNTIFGVLVLLYNYIRSKILKYNFNNTVLLFSKLISFKNVKVVNGSSNILRNIFQMLTCQEIIFRLYFLSCQLWNKILRE